jgi:hypothetical protein
MRDAEVRFYVDADILGLAHLLASLRFDVTYPGDPGAVIHKRRRAPCPITSPHGLHDDEWIPVVAERDWLIISRDSNIAEHRAEVAAVKRHGARMVALAGREATNTWAQLEIVMNRWRSIEDLLEVPGPFIYTATRTTLRKVDLGD